MLATQTEELIQRLRAGQLDLADAAHFEQVKADELLAALLPVFRQRFQDRRLSQKWEVGMARQLRFELVARYYRNSQLPNWTLVPVLRQCLFLSGEGDAVTGISISPRIVVRPLRKPFHGLALTTGRGLKLDKFPDGWELKPLARRTVRLTEEFLQQRGWRFDLLRQVAPHA